MDSKKKIGPKYLYSDQQLVEMVKQEAKNGIAPSTGTAEGYRIYQIARKRGIGWRDLCEQAGVVSRYPEERGKAKIIKGQAQKAERRKGRLAEALGVEFL